MDHAHRDHPIAVCLLGGFSIRCNENGLVSLPPQAVSLLAYLILNRDRPQTRDLLAGRFWSDLPEDRARKRLSNCLWQIRSLASDAGLPPLLETTSTTVQASTALKFDLDVETFEAKLDELEPQVEDRQTGAVAAERLAALVSDYSGDLLPGHYEDWLELERDRVRDRFHRALARLVASSKARSDYEAALRYARQLASSDPLTEEYHQEVMRIHALLGQVSAAERQYEACRSVLEAELGVAPSVNTTELIERIRSDAPSGLGTRFVPTVGESVGMVGRTREMGVLIGRVEELLGGQGGVVLVEGEPGIGKTCLMDELVGAAEWRGLRVVRAGHTELSRLQPYASLQSLLASAVVGLRGEHLGEVLAPVWLAQAAEVLPELDQHLADVSPQALKPEEESGRTSEALARVLLAQGGLGPAVMILEDVHWCDDDSMQVLAQAGRRLAGSGVLLCMTYRRFGAENEPSLWSGISELERLPTASRVVLGPLNLPEIRELLLGYVGPAGLSSAAVSTVAEMTRGNPLYVIEAARDPAAILSQREVGAGWNGAVTMPEAVAGSLRDRILALPAAVKRALEALAVLAQPATTATVAEIAGLERLPAMEALARMADKGFIDEEDGVCRFAHEQTRELVYELASSADRRELHNETYEVLSASDKSDPPRLAYHARLAGRMEQARQRFLEAARASLAVNGYRTAAEHFGQADEAADELGLDLAARAPDILAYEAVLDVLGRRDEQRILLKRLREATLPQAIEFELAERELWLLLNTEEPEKAARQGKAVVAAATGLGLPTHGLLTALAVARRRSGDLHGVLAPAERALAEAPDPAAEVAAETVLGKALIDLADHEAGLVHLQRAIDRAEQLGDLRAQVEALGYLAVGQFETGMVAAAEEHFLEALWLSRKIGYRWGEGVNLLNLAAAHTEQGHGGKAWGLFEEAQSALGSLGDTRGEAHVKLNQAVLALWVLGDLETAASCASSAAVFFRSVGDEGSECWATCVLAFVDIRRGKRRMASQRLDDLLERTQTAGLTNVEVQGRRARADLHVANGDHRAAVRELDLVLDLCEELSLEPQAPFVAAQAARHYLVLGDRRRASSYVRRALAGNSPGAERAQITAWVCAGVLEELGYAEEALGQYRVAHELLLASLDGLPRDKVEQSTNNVPEHAAIVEEYRRRVEVKADFALPAEDAPTGRPLTGEDFVVVSWTVSHPEDWLWEKEADRRQHRIQRLAGEAVAQGAVARVVDLAEALAVSDRTVKRDLASLRAAGAVVLTRRSA